MSLMVYLAVERMKNIEICEIEVSDAEDDEQLK